MKKSVAEKPKPASVSQRRKARRLILQALYQWQMNHAPAKEIEAQFRLEYQGKYDWDYFHEVFCMIPAKVAELDELINPCLDRKAEALDPIERALLRMGTFELAHRIDIPCRVVINESVELAKIFGATESHKYINGILDRLAKKIRTVEMSAK